MIHHETLSALRKMNRQETYSLTVMNFFILRTQPFTESYRSYWFIYLFTNSKWWQA